MHREISSQSAGSIVHDLLVVGGGINGCGIAADAAGRGLSVLLCEKDDLAAHTSSASSKLIHGGLRYLEHYEFRLVREALAEREVLLAKAPHIVRPLQFILPHRPHLRPAWMIRAGLFLYDHLGKREKLPGSRTLQFDSSSPLRGEIRQGFEYADCWVDDARLVVLNAMAARESGAEVLTRSRCLSAHRSDGLWQAQLQLADGSLRNLQARALVNAAGPWVASFINAGLQQKPPHGIRLIQGSHLVVSRLHEGEQAYILQNEDQRIVFVTPWLERFSLIGTTDREFHGDPDQVHISEEETAYLLKVVNAHFKRQLTAADILHSYSGVRPLCDDESDDPSAITRDYTLALSAGEDQAPLLSVFGGKLTTYRKLAEATLAALTPWFAHMGPAWTESSLLPGAEDLISVEHLSLHLQRQHRWLPASLARRWANSYGSRCTQLLRDVHSRADLGEHFGSGLYQREVEYLCREEWAHSAEDILWRRSKLGMFLDAGEQQRLQAWLEQRGA
jgi:glycerol-3-phosphate dehydrogenase